MEDRRTRSRRQYLTCSIDGCTKRFTVSNQMYILSLSTKFQDDTRFPMILKSCEKHIICRDCIDEDGFDVNTIYDDMKCPYKGKYVFLRTSKASYDNIVQKDSLINVLSDYDMDSDILSVYTKQDSDEDMNMGEDSTDAEESTDEEDLAEKIAYVGRKLTRFINGQYYPGEVQSYCNSKAKFIVRYHDDDEESITMDELEEGLELNAKYGSFDQKCLNTEVTLREKRNRKSCKDISTDYQNYLGKCRENHDFFSWHLNGQSNIDLSDVIHFDKEGLGRVYFKNFMIKTKRK